MQSPALVVRSWNGHPIQRRLVDGYVNATAMCQVGGKRWRDYSLTLRTTEYIRALERSAGIPAHHLAQTVTTGPNAGRGTWVHPRLAVDLARWISPEFAVWMDGWILEEFQLHPKPLPGAGPTITADDAAVLIGLACGQISCSLQRLAGLLCHPPTATAATMQQAGERMNESRRLFGVVDRLMLAVPAVRQGRRKAV